MPARALLRAAPVAFAIATSAAHAGDAAALEELLRNVQDRVYRLALRMLSDPEDAQDAAQEILLKIASGLKSYRGESAFTTWVYRVACNHLLNARTRRADSSRPKPAMRSPPSWRASSATWWR